MDLPLLPARMFAAGEEPSGERVNSYHKAKTINHILAALEEDEKEYLRRSPFGKLIATAERPALSGTFGHFCITRLLKVTKRHEIWVLFAGRPIRISLREFAIVTGLPCGKLPKKSKNKKRNPVREKPYWPDLFGNLKACSVDLATKMLKKKTIVDKTARLKYACLAITGAVLCPTNHRSKIILEHAELIRDFDEFLAYPWARVGFELLISSIKTKDEVALAQSTVAVKGFFHAIQLIMVEAVPSLTEVVQLNDSSSSSESEGEEEDLDMDVRSEPQEISGNASDSATLNGCEKANAKQSSTQDNPKLGLSPSHARELDEESQASVFSIIPIPDGLSLEGVDFSWSDDEDDPSVDNMVRLIEEGFQFQKDMFKGGLTQSELEKIRIERKEIAKKKDKKKAVVNASKTANDRGVMSSPVTIAEHVTACLEKDISALANKVEEIGNRVNGLRQDFSGLSEAIRSTLDAKLQAMSEKMISSIMSFLDKPLSDVAHGQGGPTTAISNSFQGLPDDQGRADTNAPARRQTTEDAAIGAAINMVNNLDVSPHTHSSLNVCAGRPFLTPFAAPFANSEIFPRSTDVVMNEHSPQNEDDSGDEAIGDEIPDESTLAGAVRSRRRSKRARTEPQGYKSYQVDPKWINCTISPHIFSCPPEKVCPFLQKFDRLEELLKSPRVIVLGNGSSINNKELLEVVSRTKHMSSKMMDALLFYARAVFSRQFKDEAYSGTEFLETTFANQLMKQFSRFSKLAHKDKHRFVFGDTVMVFLEPVTTESPGPEHIYCAYNLDKEHWLGIYIDIVGGSIHVLDCNTSHRSDSFVKKALMPIAQMLPYLVKQVLSNKHCIDGKCFIVHRSKGIPTNPNISDSGVTAALLIMAHAIGGFDRCKNINPVNLDSESKILAVRMFEEFDSPL
ncbi:uncharacterized protein LOC18025733 [Eutrema salsugineum]|uniref:uncharacterized protein LOC18025733 n=1 Tax=Eutrema salsugineum TaxID=72664 RepID=UPI000CED0C08|nr:uncharacterized protein LOC18025733 [Eutrema salsugineum]